MTDIAAVEAQGVSKVFGLGPDAVRALDNVSVTIRENEFFTLLGPSGCGKTTLLRLIAGFELPTSGDILLDGQSVADLPPYRRAVNTVFQSYALFPHMTVGENIAFGLEMRGATRADAQTHRRGDADAGADARPRRPAPVAALRRPAAARGAGPRAGQPPEGAAAGRAALGARPQAAPGHALGAEGAAEAHRHHLRLRHPRPGRGADHVATASR